MPSRAISPKNERSEPGVSTAAGISWAIVPPVEVTTRDLVGLALDPRMLDPQGLGAQAADRRVAALERGEGVVDHDLRDRHRVGAVVAQVELDHAGREHGALDRQLLRGWPAPLAETGRPERGEQPDRQCDQRQRHQPEQPRGAARGPARLGGGAARLHQLTSKKPCQPSSVNSD